MVFIDFKYHKTSTAPIYNFFNKVKFEAVVASGCFPQNHHLRKIYNEFTLLDDEVKAEVLRQADLNVPLIKGFDWVDEKIGALEESSRKLGLGDAFLFVYFSLSSTLLSVFLSLFRIIKILMNEAMLTMRNTKKKRTNKPNKKFKRSV